MGYEISKDFFCDYGHRVWTQELKEHLCAGGVTSCKCKHLHGHTGKITVEVTSDELKRGFVTDFKHLGFIKDFVDEYFDHRFIIDRNDPLFGVMTNGFKATHNLAYADSVMRFVRKVAKEDEDLTVQFDLTAEQIEYIESFTVVNFVPTSENLAKFMFEYASNKLFDEAVVSSVTWQETPKSKAVYRA